MNIMPYPYSLLSRAEHGKTVYTDVRADMYSLWGKKLDGTVHGHVFSYTT